MVTVVYNNVPKLLIICSQNVNGLFNNWGQLSGIIIMSKGTEQNNKPFGRKAIIMVKFDKLTSFDLYNQEDDEIVCFYNLDQILENIEMARYDLFANGTNF